MRIAAALLVVALSAPLAAQERAHPTMLVACHVTSPAALDWLLGDPHFEVLARQSPIAVECLIHARDLALLESRGYAPKVIHADLEAHYASRLTTSTALATPLGSMGGYFTFAEVLAQLDAWRTQYPNLITARFSIGKSIENRDQWMVKVSANADVDENEPEILMHSLIHAREPASMMSTMRMVEFLLTNYGTDPVVTDLLDNREIWYVPVFNPDGYEYNRTIRPGGGGLWRKNRRFISGSTYGIDLNRNFGFQWGYDSRGSSGSPSSNTYRGTGAFSEPETANARDFVNSRVPKGLTCAWDCHCHAGYCLYPFSYANVPSPKAAIYAEISADMVRQNNYTAGTGYQVLYPMNGSTLDWYEGGAGLYAWLPEIGHGNDGFWPPTNRIRALAEEVLGMLVTGVKYAGPYLVTTAQTVTEVGDNDGSFEPGERVEVRATVRNRGVVGATNARIRLVAASPFVTIEVPEAPLGAIATVTDKNNNGAPVRALISPLCAPGTDLGLAVEVAFDGHVLRTPLDIVCGSSTNVVTDACETATWTMGAPTDTATTGIWTHGDPNPTWATSGRKYLVQTGDDHSPSGTRCYVTGNQTSALADTDDVDNGRTTLTTPTYDLSAARDPWVSYWRWFMDHGPNPNTDALLVDVTADGGATWVRVETVTRSEQAWRRHAFRLRDFVDPTNAVRLRFITSDAPDDSFCEAAIDDLRVDDHDDGTRIALQTPARVGTTATIALTAARSPNLPFATGVAFGARPGIALASGRTIPLNPDALFGAFSLLPSVFRDFVGTLDGSGTGASRIDVPNAGALVGVSFRAAFLTLDAAAPDGIRDVSASLPIVIAP